MRKPAVRQAVHAIRAAAIEGDLASLALSTMRNLMADDLTPAPVRFQAAKWTLETAGHKAAEALGAPAPEKELHEMSLQELETFIARGKLPWIRSSKSGRSLTCRRCPRQSAPHSAPSAARA
jgi:hypothetical protein